jgi:hypothetical protein
MTHPPQQPGSWQDPSWQPAQQEQPYADPYAGSQGYAVPPGSPASGYQGYPGYGYGGPIAAPPPTNTMAIVSLVLSLVGLACGLAAPVGAILGHVARRQIRERGENGAGMALAGIIVGWIVTGLYLIYVAFLIVFVIYAAKNGSTTSTY